MKPWEQLSAVISIPRFDYNAPSSILRHSHCGFLVTAPSVSALSLSNLYCLAALVAVDVSSKLLVSPLPCALLVSVATGQPQLLHISYWFSLLHLTPPPSLLICPACLFHAIISLASHATINLHTCTNQLDRVLLCVSDANVPCCTIELTAP
nr:Checkpoint protein like [Ipomoea batatas]